jgi:hypothetical protein
MSLSDDLKLKLEQQTAARISKEAPVKKLLHTIYLGDRTIQQLGQEPIDNGIKLNNASVAIGDPMLPLAKGDVLRRVDSINRNGGKALGSAQRTALERDGLANNRTNGLGENGNIAPINDPNIGTPLSNNPAPVGFDPPFGCEPPVQNCVWLNTAIAPNGYGSHGSVVLNNDGLELYLYCTLGTTPPPDLGCDFNRKWKCVNGVCVQDANGAYASQAECQAALVVPKAWRWNFTYYEPTTGCSASNFTPWISGSPIETDPSTVWTTTSVPHPVCTSGNTVSLFKNGIFYSGNHNPISNISFEYVAYAPPSCP